MHIVPCKGLHTPISYSALTSHPNTLNHWTCFFPLVRWETPAAWFLFPSLPLSIWAIAHQAGQYWPCREPLPCGSFPVIHCHSL